MKRIRESTALVELRRARVRFDRTLAGKLVERVLELNPLERSLALGSKLFTTVVPLAIIVSAIFGTGDGVATRLIDGFGLSGAGAHAVRALFDVPGAEVGSAISLIGILVLGYSLLSFARALQRIYEDAWHLPPLRSRGIAWGGLWMVAFALYFSMSSPLSRVLYEHGYRVSGTIVSLLGGTALWLVTPFILLGRRVRPRILLPGGIATAILLAAFNVGSIIYLPHSTTGNVNRYGLIGVTFTLLSWLFGFSVMLVVAAACGAVLAERRSDWTDPRLRVAEAPATADPASAPQGPP